MVPSISFDREKALKRVIYLAGTYPQLINSKRSIENIINYKLVMDNRILFATNTE